MSSKDRPHSKEGQLSIVCVWKTKGVVCGCWGQASGWPSSLALMLEQV